MTQRLVQIMWFKIAISLLVLFRLSECGYNCTSRQLEECTQNLLRFSKEDVPIPETEDEVRANCM